MIWMSGNYGVGMADFSSARINQRPPPYHPLWACKCKCRHRHRRAVNFALRISPHQAVDLTTNISAQPDQDQPEQPSRPDPVFHTRAARRQKTPVTGARGSTHLDAPLCAQKQAWPGCWSGRLGSTQTGLAASVGSGGTLHCLASSRVVPEGPGLGSGIDASSCLERP